MPERKPALSAEVTGNILHESCANGRLENTLLLLKQLGFDM